MPEPPAEAELTPADAGYWVVRFAPPAQRPALQAVLQWNSELERTVDRCRDPGATRLKLDWWRQELARPEAARHPLARPLAGLAARPPAQAALQAMLDAAEAMVRRQQPADHTTFLAHCDQAGALAHLLVLTTDSGTSEHHQAIILGRYAEAVRQVQQLGRRLQHDHNPLPADLIPAGAPAHWPDTDLAACCDALLAPLHDAAAPLLRGRHRHLAPARRWASQARALHRLLRREGYPVRDQLLDITPLARLWTAWRVR